MARLAMWLWGRLFLRLQIFVGMIGALCLVLAIVGFNAEKLEQQLDQVSEATMKKQALVERVNGLVYAVVMESRGLYMADAPDKIERFGKGLEAHLASLETTRKDWKALVEPADTRDFEAFEKNADVFVRLRRELVAEARAKGAAGARAVGDNEANRSTRTAFNKSLETLANTYKARIVEIEAQNEAKHFWVALINRSILGIVVLMALAGWAWLARYMSRPFNDISDALRRINAGDAAFQVQHQARVDEVGIISRAIETFRQQSIQRAEIERVKSDESARKTERQARFEQAISAFESAATVRVESVAKTANDLHHASSVLSSSAEEAARQVHIVTEHSEEMATNISSLSHIGDQLVHAIGEIAEGMGRASEVSQQASSLSTETATKFTDLEQAVAAITDVVDIINQIAGQTNLLALNATIEAARAGEAGRGFAVVAAEVKQLAAQTTRATADISANVSHVQAVAGDSIAAVEAIGGIIEDMRRIAIEVTSSVEEQRVATQAIASSVRAAANGTQAVTDNIAGVAKAAEETGAASVQLLGSAGKLAGEASGIKGEVERFLTTIRAA